MRLRRSEALRYAHALVGSGRRHPNIRHDYIRPGVLYGGQKRRLVVSGRDEI